MAPSWPYCQSTGDFLWRHIIVILMVPNLARAVIHVALEWKMSVNDGQCHRHCPHIYR